jgi:hypothetical protein
MPPTAPSLRDSLKLYGAYQLAGVALGLLSIASMLVADVTVLQREPRLPVLFILGLAGLFGALGAFLAWRRHTAAR